MAVRETLPLQLRPLQQVADYHQKTVASVVKAMRIIEVLPNLHLRSCTKTIGGMRQALARAYLLQAFAFFLHYARIDVAALYCRNRVVYLTCWVQ